MVREFVGCGGRRDGLVTLLLYQDVLGGSRLAKVIPEIGVGGQCLASWFSSVAPFADGLLLGAVFQSITKRVFSRIYLNMVCTRSNLRLSIDLVHGFVAGTVLASRNKKIHPFSSHLDLL